MGAKPVQISLDRELLERIDRDPEARQKGRSAFVRSAVERYLAAKARDELESRLVSAYGGRADQVQQEVEGLADAQAWPSE